MHVYTILNVEIAARRKSRGCLVRYYVRYNVSWNKSRPLNVAQVTMN